jgi:hypothetical protein
MGAKKSEDAVTGIFLEVTKYIQDEKTYIH